MSQTQSPKKSNLHVCKLQKQNDIHASSTLGFVGSHEREERETVRERWRQTASQPDIPTNRANARARERERERQRETESVCVCTREKETDSMGEWVRERECFFFVCERGKERSR